MNEISLAEAVYSIIKKQRDIHEEMLIYGNMKDMEEYRETIGYLRGLEHVEQELKSLLEKQERIID